MLASTVQVLPRQLARFQQQQFERAPQCTFGAEVGPAQLLQEFTHPRGAHTAFLAAVWAEMGLGLGKRLATIEAALWRQAAGHVGCRLRSDGVFHAIKANSQATGTANINNTV